MTSGDVKKVVLAYSGGLDTSVILKWLEETYGCEIVTFTADLGQGEELEPARAKAEMFGVKEIYIEDLREEFVRDYVFPMFRANAVYEGRLSAGHVHRPPADRQAPDRDRPETGADACPMAPPARATIRCGSSSAITRSTRHQGDCALARMGSDVRTKLIEYAEATRSRSRRTSAAKRPSRSTPTFCTFRRRQGAGRSLGESPEYIYSRSVAPRTRPIRRPISRSVSSTAIRWPSTARRCRRPPC